VAAEHQVDLVALATHGAGAILRAVMGSVATAVLGRSPVPVLLAGPRVKPARGDGQYALLMTSDGSLASQLVVPAIGKLLTEASPRGVALTLLRVQQEEGQRQSTEASVAECLDGLRALAREAATPVPIACEVRKGSRVDAVHRDIMDVAAERHANAIAMATHGHTFRHDTFLGSVAFDTLRNAEIPLLLVNAASRRSTT
jgi:nucleotide-binding universal stress UspA family protein